MIPPKQPPKRSLTLGVPKAISPAADHQTSLSLRPVASPPIIAFVEVRAKPPAPQKEPVQQPPVQAKPKPVTPGPSEVKKKAPSVPVEPPKAVTPPSIPKPQEKASAAPQPRPKRDKKVAPTSTYKTDKEVACQCTCCGKDIMYHQPINVYNLQHYCMEKKCKAKAIAAARADHEKVVRAKVEAEMRRGGK